MTNLPFQASGSHSEKLISLPMTPSTLHSATGEAAGVAAVIFTSGAVKPFIASQTVCACAAPDAAIVIPAASAAAQTVPLSMSSSRGFFCAEPATHGGGPQRHRHANRAH